MSRHNCTNLSAALFAILALTFSVQAAQAKAPGSHTGSESHKGHGENKAPIHTAPLNHTSHDSHKHEFDKKPHEHCFPGHLCSSEHCHTDYCKDHCKDYCKDYCCKDHCCKDWCKLGCCGDCFPCWCNRPCFGFDCCVGGCFGGCECVTPCPSIEIVQSAPAPVVVEQAPPMIEEVPAPMGDNGVVANDSDNDADNN